MKTKNSQIDSNIDPVLKDLSSLKTSLNTDNIQSKLFALNTSFTVLLNTLKKKMPSEVKFELSHDNNRYLNDIKLYKYLNCSIMTINDRILKVETGNKQLDILCMKKKKIEEVEELIYMFNESACDKCGLYFCKIDMEMAVVRQKEKDYISVYHKKCQEMK